MRRKSVATSKFYFFDIGVAHALQGVTSLVPQSVAHGVAFEHLIANEIRAALHYSGKQLPLQYWKNLSQMEVDFVVGDHLAVEVKVSGRVGERDAKGLRVLSEDVKLKRRIIVSNEREPRCFDDRIEALPVGLFLDQLWSGVLW